MHLTLVLRNAFTHPVHQVKVTTCGSLYQRWRDEQLMYRNAPVEGLEFDIEYADTKTEVSTDPPLVLSLHGAPGTYKDFTSVINNLTRNGVRVVAPNFPDCGSTIRNGIFRNSAEEKAEFLRDFLKIIGVSKIDTLMAHSSALYPAMLLYLNGWPEVRSLALLNPTGHKMIRAIHPYWFIYTFVQLYFFELGRNIISKVGIPLLKMTNAKVRLDNLDDVVMAACAMIYSGYDQFEEKLHMLRKRKTPTLMLFSENDKLIQQSISYEMAKILGASPEHIWLYDKNGNVIRTGKSSDWLKVIAIQEGSHYAMWKFPSIVNKALSELIQSVTNKSYGQHSI